MPPPPSLKKHPAADVPAQDWFFDCHLPRNLVVAWQWMLSEIASMIGDIAARIVFGPFLILVPPATGARADQAVSRMSVRPRSRQIRVRRRTQKG